VLVTRLKTAVHLCPDKWKWQSPVSIRYNSVNLPHKFLSVMHQVMNEVVQNSITHRMTVVPAKHCSRCMT